MFVEKNRRFHTNLGLDPRRSLDPDKLYREQYIKAKASATGVGKLVFEFIPFSVIKSFALAIDPFAKFRALPIKVSPVSRTRTRSIQSVLDLRKYKMMRKRDIYYSVIWSTIGGPPGLFCYSPPLKSPLSATTVLESGTNAVPIQPNTVMRMKDTTTRTRPMGSELGELEMFKFQIHSPSLNFRIREVNKDSLTMQCNNQINWFIDELWTEDTGPGGTMSKAALDGLHAAEKTRLENLMSDKALGLVSKTVPMARRYTAFRNVAELKDLPRSVLSLKRALENFNQSISIMSNRDLFNLRKYINLKAPKDIPGEYVSYHFGWKQLYRDVLDLLVKPVRASREINRLMRRSGQPTTFRSFSKVVGDVTTTPAFSYAAPWSKQTNVSDSTSHTRHHELRCVVNATFDFPKVNVPRFEHELFMHKLGAYPMPADMYNLIPWSWLVDWFTGLGNYVEAIDSINTDKSLINWGILTGITKGKITTVRNYTVTDRLYGTVDHKSYNVNTPRRLAHTSVLEYTLQIRKDVVSAYDVKSTLEPASLSLYQQSILAAIFASRRK
jgi:hypothetical protein